MTPFHKAFARLVGDILGRRWFRQRQKQLEKQNHAVPVRVPVSERPATPPARDSRRE